jgi:hypothetical protein
MLAKRSSKSSIPLLLYSFNLNFLISFLPSHASFFLRLALAARRVDRLEGTFYTPIYVVGSSM